MNAFIAWIRKRLFKKIIDLQHVLLEIAQKKAALEESRNSITGIVLGSSHGAYGFDPNEIDPCYFNLCSTSQDLYYSYHLFLYSKKKLTQCKKVFLFFSVFSPGYEVQNTADKHIAAFFNAIYRIKPKYSMSKKLRKLSILCKIFIKFTKLTANHPLGFNPLGVYFPADYAVEERCEKHLRENTRANDQFDYLDKLHNAIKKNGMELIIVIPPARADYRAGLPAHEIVFSHLYSYVHKQQIKVVNFFDSPIFLEADFGDFDHLTLSGAQKLTQELSRLTDIG